MQLKQMRLRQVSVRGACSVVLACRRSAFIILPRLELTWTADHARARHRNACREKVCVSPHCRAACHALTALPRCLCAHVLRQKFVVGPTLASTSCSSCTPPRLAVLFAGPCAGRHLLPSRRPMPPTRRSLCLISAVAVRALRPQLARFWPAPETHCRIPGYVGRFVMLLGACAYGVR